MYVDYNFYYVSDITDINLKYVCTNYLWNMLFCHFIKTLMLIFNVKLPLS